MSNKLKIFLVSHSAENSGAPRVLLEVAELLKEDYDITICFPENKGAAREARDMGLNVIIIPNPQVGFSETRGITGKIGILRNRLRYILKIRKVVKKNGYPIIYLNSAASVYAGLGLYGLGKKIIWHLHEDFVPGLYNRFRRFVITRLSDLLIFVSPSNAEYFKGKLSGIKTLILPNGVKLERFGKFEIDEDYRKKFQYKIDDIIIATLSYISHRKGIDIFEKAMVRVIEQFPEVKAVVPGDRKTAAPEYLKEVDEIAEKEILKNRLFLPGHCTNVPSFLDCVDIFVLPSRNDPMPLAVLEALAAGKPVVASDVGNLREMVAPPGDELQAGIIVPPENPEALAEAILELLQNPEKRKVMSENALKKAERDYSMETFRKRIKEAVNTEASMFK